MTTIALRPPTGPHAGARGPAFGLGISLLVHAGVLAWLMHALAPVPNNAAKEKPVAPMQVRLEHARPAPPTQPETPAASTPAEPARVRADAPARPVSRHAPRPHPRADAPASTPAPARASETPDVITSRHTNAPDLFAVPQPSAGPDAGPVVDLDAARREARRIAREESRNLVSLPARKPVTDPNEGRPADIDPLEKARRSDCKSAYAGLGLLAVIPLVEDAITGTGCKW